MAASTSHREMGAKDSRRLRAAAVLFLGWTGSSAAAASTPGQPTTTLTHDERSAGASAAAERTGSWWSSPRIVLHSTVGIAGIGIHPVSGRTDARLGISSSGLVFSAGGGAVFNALAVGAAAEVFFASHQQARLPGGERVAIARPLQFLSIGPQLVWYPWGSVGFHCAAGMRGFLVPSQGAVGAAPRVPWQGGVGGQIELGHDWVVTPGLQIGALARGLWGSTFRDETGVAAYQVAQLAVAFTATFR